MVGPDRALLILGLRVVGDVARHLGDGTLGPVVLPIEVVSSAGVISYPQVAIRRFGGETSFSWHVICLGAWLEDRAHEVDSTVYVFVSAGGRVAAAAIDRLFERVTSALSLARGYL